MDTLDIIRQMQADPALAEQLRDIVLGRELLDLPAAFQRLADAQAKTDASVDRLVKSIDRLEAAQAKTDANVDRLEKSIDRLEAAQAKTDVSVARLTSEVGKLSEVVGGTVEVDAESVVTYVLSKKGWEVTTVKGPSVGPVDLLPDGEIDVVLSAVDPTGARRWILVEAKTRLRPEHVNRFVRSFGSLAAKAGYAVEDCVGYVYGLRVYPGCDEAAGEGGVGLADSRGERVPHPLAA